MDNKTLERLMEIKKVRENEREEERARKQMLLKSITAELMQCEGRIRELIEIIELLITEYNVPKEKFSYGNIYYDKSYGIKRLYLGGIFSSRFCVGYDCSGKYHITDVLNYLTDFMTGFPAFERHVYEIADKVIKSEETRLMSKAQTYEVKIVFNANGQDADKAISEIIGRMGGVIVSFGKDNKK